MVGSRTGGLTEVVGDAGVLVPPADPIALADGLVAALVAETAWTWACKGRERLLAHFLPGPWIAITVAQYQGILRSPGH